MNKKGMVLVGIGAAVLLVILIIWFANSESKGSLGEQTSGNTQQGSTPNGTQSNNGEEPDGETVVIAHVTDIERVEGYKWDDSITTTKINLGEAKNTSEVKVDGSNVKISGNDIVIGAAGQYEVSGSIAEGRIIVDAKDKEVYIKLNNADINCSFSSAIYTYDAAKVTIVLAEGSENSLTDGTSYDFNDDYSDESLLEPNACLYSKSDLLICGSGKLSVNGQYEQGITGKDSLYITEATIDAVAKGKAVLGKDKLCSDTATITANSTDDALHSNGNILLAGGKYTLSSGDDGIHADAGVVSDGGTIRVLESEEGIEGWQISLINSDIEIKSNDDGINATSLNSDEVDFGFGGGFGGPGGGEMTEGGMPGGMGNPPEKREADLGVNSAPAHDSTGVEDDAAQDEIFVNTVDTRLIIDAGGDGLDSNGSIYMNGGEVIVYGPENGGNGGLDYAARFELVSGTLLVMDVTGMNMTPSSTSVPGIDVTLGENLNAGDIVCVSSDGYKYCFKSLKNSNHFTLFAPNMKSGDEISVLYGVSADVETGVVSDSASVSGGSEDCILTLEDGIVYSGSTGGLGGPGFGHGGRPDDNSTER